MTDKKIFKLVVVITALWIALIMWILYSATCLAVSPTTAVDVPTEPVVADEYVIENEIVITPEDILRATEEYQKEQEEFYRNLDLTKLPGVEGPSTVSTININEDDAITLAKLVYGEGRGIPSKAQKAAIIWCVLNRVDDSRFGNTVYDVVTAKNQFEGYKATNPVWDELLELSRDVLERWEREKNGEENVGRTLPKDYFFFYGNGKVNKFTKQWREKTYWNWTLESPYDS